MGILTPIQLSKISKEDINDIIYRKSIDLTKVMDEVIIPLSQDIKTDTKNKVLKYTRQWDKCRPDPLLVIPDEMETSYKELMKTKPEVMEAFSKAIDNITSFHKKQLPDNVETLIGNNTLGLRFTPFDRVALYVPGGKALYPSTVLMGVIPAKIAGVKDITIVSPPNSETGKVSNIVKAMGFLVGASRIVQAGGAQAVLAMAYGMPEENILPVDYIYGPGNKFVAAAKNFVFSNNYCGIDSFAGPSEVLIIADHSANPYYLAHDLMAQAEHDEDASAILLCTSKERAEETIHHIEQALAKRKERESITRNSIQKNGKIILVNSIEDAVEFSNQYAPEHLEIQTSRDDEVLNKITSAGSIFVGTYAPVAIGDYFSGTNHILPTNRAARFSSGVSVHSFFKRITWQKISKEGLKASCEPITHMSKEEGLFDEHGYSVLSRFE
ncbi:MAG: histidinol dehydrogenase [Spirochaetia bacterium]|nr:histidinol dehydrogenase [Spirochaetia bacterium]